MPIKRKIVRVRQWSDDKNRMGQIRRSELRFIYKAVKTRNPIRFGDLEVMVTMEIRKVER